MRTRVKRSIVWKMSDVDFMAMVKSSVSVGDICRKLSGRKGGSIFSNIKRRIDMMHIATPHFIDCRDGKHNTSYVSKNEFLQRLQRGSFIDPKWMKRKLIEFSFVKNECSECGQQPIWNNKPLTIHLDHIDGDFLNNEISNLRMLCPHCHTQTPTYSIGKNRKRKMVDDSGVEPLNSECHSDSLPLA